MSPFVSPFVNPFVSLFVNPFVSPFVSPLCVLLRILCESFCESLCDEDGWIVNAEKKHFCHDGRDGSCFDKYVIEQKNIAEDATYEGH